MTRKWRNSQSDLDTGNGTLSLDKGLYSNKARDSIRFSIRTEEGEPVGRKYYNKETGEVLDSKPDFRAYTIGDEEVQLTRQKINQLKEMAYSSDGWNLQKVIDEEEIERERLCKEAKQVEPNEEAVTNLEYIWNGLMETGKALVVKHAPSRNENLYVVWANENGLFQQQYLYPQEFEAEDTVMEAYDGETAEKTAQLVEKLSENCDTEEIVNNQRGKLEEAIEKKMAGEELDLETGEEEQREQELEELI